MFGSGSCVFRCSKLGYQSPTAGLEIRGIHRGRSGAGMSADGCGMDDMSKWVM